MCFLAQLGGTHGLIYKSKTSAMQCKCFVRENNAQFESYCLSVGTETICAPTLRVSTMSGLRSEMLGAPIRRISISNSSYDGSNMSFLILARSRQKKGNGTLGETEGVLLGLTFNMSNAWSTPSTP